MSYLERGLFPSVGAAAIAFCFSLSASAAAAPIKPPPPPANAAAPVAALDNAKDDPVKIAAARGFILAYRPKLAPPEVSAAIDKMMPRLVEEATRGNPKLDVKKFEQETRERMTRAQVAKVELQVHIVSHHFTLQELKDLQAFFSGPVGKKLISESPSISREIMQQARTLVPARMGKMTVEPAPKKK